MKTCPKCKTEMVHGNVETTIRIYGDEIKPAFPKASYQKSYAPVDAFICKKCGFIELYTQLIDEDENLFL